MNGYRALNTFYIYSKNASFMKITLRGFHRYISLVISIQLLLWTISGIYFSFNKIEEVRGEQYLVKESDSKIKGKEDLEKINLEAAKRLVLDKTTLTPIELQLLEEPKRGSEFRGRDLPLYKVVSVNEEGEKINVYLNPYSGEIVAIRSLKWRLWDLMWGLHIMDWVDRDNIDNIFLKLFSFIALFTALSGVVLFIYRK